MHEKSEDSNVVYIPLSPYVRTVLFMNEAERLFIGMNEDQWEYFAIDFLSIILECLIEEYPAKGPDGGKDGIVSKNGIKYIVSAKHYIYSGKSVGISIEHSIRDRMDGAGADGFIGFYSTMVTNTLRDRISEIKNAFYLDGNMISNHIPSIPSMIIQKYGKPNGMTYHLNVPYESYTSLPCIICGTDILTKEMERQSLASIVFNKQGRPLRGDFLPSAALPHLSNLPHFLLSILTGSDPENSKG